jgi:transcriptional regulator with XRE-family HTH domain
MSKPSFKQWIYDKGYTLKDLAATIDVDRTTLYLWMKGKRKPFPSHMMRIKILSKGLFTHPEDLTD